MRDIILIKGAVGRCSKDLEGLVAERRKNLDRSIRCDLNARFKVNGQGFCHPHALKEVFQLVLDENS